MSAVRAPSPDLLLLGRGIVRWAPIKSDGTRLPYLDMGNVTQLSVNTADTKITKNSSRTSATTIYKQITSARIVTITIQGDEFDADIMAAVMMGTVEDVAATAGATVTAEAHTAPGELDAIIKLNHPLVSTVVVKHSSTVYVEGTDYVVVDAARGFVKFLSTGAIVATNPFTVDYVWAAEAAKKRIVAGTQNVIEASLYFAADNADGPNRDLIAYKVSMEPNGDQGFISDALGNWTLKCTVEDDSAGLYGGSSDSPLYEMFDSPVAA